MECERVARRALLAVRRDSSNVTKLTSSGSEDLNACCLVTVVVRAKDLHGEGVPIAGRAVPWTRTKVFSYLLLSYQVLGALLTLQVHPSSRTKIEALGPPPAHPSIRLPCAFQATACSPLRWYIFHHRVGF